MTVTELLRYIREDILRDRNHPRLWSDDFLRALLNEAQRLHARRTHCLMSDEQPFCELFTEEGVHTYELDSQIAHVLEVRHVGDSPCLLRPVRRSQLPRGPLLGKPGAYSLDAGSRRVKLYPTPDDEGYELALYVAYMPQPLTDTTDNLTIPEDYHLDLALYVASRALRSNDVDGNNTGEAERFLMEWERAILRAKRDVYVQRNGATPLTGPSWTLKR